MPTFSQVFKSSVGCAFALALVYFGMSSIAEMPYPVENGVLAPFNPDLFGIAMWLWAAIAGGTGAFLGMVHTFEAPETDAHASYLGAIEFVFFAWLAFAVLHLFALVFTTVHGGVVMTVAAFAVAAAVLFLWHCERPAIALDMVKDLPPQVPPTWTV